MKNQNFQFLISKQKQVKEEEKTDSSFNGTVLGIVLAFLVFIGMLAYVDRWVPILSSILI